MRAVNISDETMERLDLARRELRMGKSEAVDYLLRLVLTAREQMDADARWRMDARQVLHERKAS